MSRYAGMERGAQFLAGAMMDRRERKDEQKRERQLIEGMEKMMEHPAVARYFPEDFDPYAVGAQGTLQALDLASRAIALEGQEAQTQAQRTQTDAQRMQTDRLRQGFEGEERLLRGLSQTAGGVGEGVLRPEVVDRQRAMLADPAVATAVEHGVPLEVAQRYFPGGGEAGGFRTPEEAREVLQRLGVKGQVTQRGDGGFQIQFQDPGPENLQELENRVVGQEELDQIMERYNVLAVPLADGTYRLQNVRPIREDFLDSVIRRGFEAGASGLGEAEGRPPNPDVRPRQQQTQQQPQGQRTPARGNVLEQSLEQQFGR